MRSTFYVLRIGLVTLAVAGGLLLLGWLSYVFVLQPQITINAPDGSTVRITNMQDDTQVAQATISGSSATLRTSTGSYSVTVDSKTASQMFYTKTGWLQRVTLQFRPATQLTHTLLAHQTSYNAVGSDHSFTYFNTTAQDIEQINGGTKAVLDNFGTSLLNSAAMSAQAMEPIAGNRAVVITHGQLYVLENGRLDALNTDGFPDNISSLAIGANRSQASFAILANSTLYWYQSPSAQPKQVLVLTKQADQLAIGGDEVIAYSTRMPDAQQDIRYAYTPSYVIDPILISITSGSQQTITQGPIVDASISPDGQYATIEHRSSSHTDILRLTDNSVVQSVENADTLSPQWVSNSRYVYGKGSSIWTYDVTALKANEIATLPTGQLVTSVTYNSDLQQYLVTTYPNEQGAAVYQLQ